MPKKTKVAPRKVSIPSVGATTKKSVEVAKPVAPSGALKRLIASSKNGQKMTITPSLAAELLTMNVNNRRVKKERVALYASSMTRGQWSYTGDSIRIAKGDNGEDILIDGQHRLLACVQSGVSFETHVISGLPASVFSVIDRGVTRTNGDILKVAGFSNSTFIGSMVRPVIACDAGFNPLQHGTMVLVTGDDIVSFCTEHEDLVEWAKNLGNKAKYSIGGLNSAWGMFAIFASRVRGRKLIEQFIDETGAGVGLSEGDPRLAIRSFMLKTGTSMGPNVRNFREAGTIMRIFNAYVEGRKVKVVRQWGLRTDDEFPKVSTATPFDWKNGKPSEASDID
ncbi:MAG: hypothetical protein EBT80_00455 [Chitinophagales bacterium]|nr:hypothetical protein [Chitinophagales bacterium]